jgi:hypothetical protein
MTRIGKARMANSAIACTSSPVVMTSSETRHAPTASRATVPRFGRASSAGSKAARSRPMTRRSRRRSSAAVRMRADSRSSRPSSFTTSAASKLSWATEDTSPTWAWARAAGPTTRVV